MDNLSLLSLVVPTYNRQPFALRQMEFWSNTPVNLYVLDGSEQPIDDDLTRIFPANIHYLHRPVSLIERLESAIGLIETPYAMMLGDDDFFIPSAVSQCVEELAGNASLVSCMGLSASFLYGPENSVLGRDVYGLLVDYKIDQDDAADRMAFHMDPYICSIVYSAMRADVWKKNIQLVTQSHFSTPVATELQIELGACFQGKSKTNNTLLWMRSSENAPISNSNWDRGIDFVRWYGAPEFEGEREAFVSGFVDHFANDGDSETVHDAITQALAQLHHYLTTRPGGSGSSQGTRRIAPAIRACLEWLVPSLLNSVAEMNAERKRRTLTDEELVTYATQLSTQRGFDVDLDAVSNIAALVGDFRART